MNRSLQGKEGNYDVGLKKSLFQGGVYSRDIVNKMKAMTGKIGRR